MADRITTALTFLDKIREEGEVTVKFRKKDGEERIMRCTLDMEKVPMAQRPKSVNLAKILRLLNTHNILHVYDMDIGDWRSVPFDRSEWLETTDNRRYKIGG